MEPSLCFNSIILISVSLRFNGCCSPSSICITLYEYLLFSNCALGQSIIFINALLVINRPTRSISISSIFNLQFLSVSFSKACQQWLSLKVVHNCKNTKTRERVSTPRELKKSLKVHLDLI